MWEVIFIIKKCILFSVVFLLIFLLFSCSEDLDADKLLGEFIAAYGAEGVIYSPTVSEGDNGYIDEGFVDRIYVYEGEFPENYAIFLNSHPYFGSECGVFICANDYERELVTEMCEERIELIGRTDGVAFILRSGNVIFYSTFEDREMAEALWRKIIKSYT